MCLYCVAVVLQRFRRDDKTAGLQLGQDLGAIDPVLPPSAFGEEDGPGVLDGLTVLLLTPLLQDLDSRVEAATMVEDSSQQKVIGSPVGLDPALTHLLQRLKHLWEVAGPCIALDQVRVGVHRRLALVGPEQRECPLGLVHALGLDPAVNDDVVGIDIGLDAGLPHLGEEVLRVAGLLGVKDGVKEEGHGHMIGGVVVAIHVADDLRGNVKLALKKGALEERIESDHIRFNLGGEELSVEAEGCIDFSVHHEAVDHGVDDDIVHLLCLLDVLKELEGFLEMACLEIHAHELVADSRVELALVRLDEGLGCVGVALMGIKTEKRDADGRVGGHVRLAHVVVYRQGQLRASCVDVAADQHAIGRHVKRPLL